MSVTVVNPAFDPLAVPELAAGRRFDFAKQTGLGTSGFAIASQPAGDNLVQSSVSNQPSYETRRGEGVFTAVANNKGLEVTAPSAALRGTGPVVYSFWFTTPDSAASFQTLCQVRDGSQPTQFRFMFQRINSKVLFECYATSTGSSTGEGRFMFTVGDNLTPKYAQLILDLNNANPFMRIRLFINRVEIGPQNIVAIPTQGGLFASTAPLRVMGPQFLNTGLVGVMGSTFDVLNGIPSSKVLDKFYLTRALSEPRLASYNLLCDGNSITQAFGGTDQIAGYPYQLSLLLGRNFGVTTVGTGGIRTDQLVTDFPNKIAPRYNASKARNFLLMFENLNYVTFGATTQQAYDKVLEYAALANAAGFEVIAATAPATGTSQPGLGSLGAINALIRANWPSYAVALVDFEVCPSLVPAGVGLNPTNWFDATHPKDAGYLGMAQFAAPTIQALVA
jgi:hypothetical protein